jgi:hypothetical protein
VIDASFIQKIVEISQPGILEVADRPYSTKPIHPVFDPTPEAIKVATLTAIADYVTKIAPEDPVTFLHVSGPRCVQFLSILDEKWMTRKNFVIAEHIGDPFSFNSYMDVESFIVGLQADFMETSDRELILRLASNLSSNLNVTLSDDGIAQKVTVNKGVSMVEAVTPPRRVKLRPFRTFLEVEQPESEFILRIQAGDKTPRIALFTADGGGWKLTAMQSIKDWLAARLPEVIILA